ncbi:MAG: dephospho-CoA kinase [Caulobacterales bacterium 68-7]|nr:dephospho-CoA kinase [Caulobacterales bacterium]OJU13261.1 MAG: dephospho-CoA kinase [Caulobacterales bacterium 68-7]
MIVVGLTGSIGMGKTTTARLFAEAGAAVQDADEVVQRLYAPGGAAVAPVSAAFPGVLGDDGGIDRKKLSAAVTTDRAALARLETIVHPLVAADRETFLAQAREEGRALAVLEVQLLFETGLDKAVDAVVVVSATPEVQRARVLTRPGMTEEKFQALLARQTPDAEKRARADYVIDTGRGIEAARDQVRDIIALLRTRGPA